MTEQDPILTPDEILQLKMELEEVNQRLEKASENENTIERFFERDALLEEQGWLLEALATTTISQESEET